MLEALLGKVEAVEEGGEQRVLERQVELCEVGEGQPVKKVPLDFILIIMSFSTLGVRKFLISCILVELHLN